MQKLAVPAALVIGVLLGFIGKSLVSTDATPASDSENAEVAQLRAENTKLRAQLDEPAKPSSPSAIVKSSGGGGTSAPKLKVVRSGEAGGGKKVEFDVAAMQKRMKEQQRQRDAKKTAMQMAALKDRLGLSEEQEEKVKALLDALAAGERGRVARIFGVAADGGSGGATITAEALTPPENTFDDDLLALLDDDQKTAYAEYLDDKRSNEIEATANRDLASLQSMFSLSDDQKDKAFEAFTSLASDSIDSQAALQAGSFDPSKIMAARQARLDALEPILTPEQMELYKDSPNAHSAVMFGTGSLGGNAVFQSIAIDVPATVTTETINIEAEE